MHGIILQCWGLSFHELAGYSASASKVLNETDLFQCKGKIKEGILVIKNFLFLDGFKLWLFGH